MRQVLPTVQVAGIDRKAGSQRLDRLIIESERELMDPEPQPRGRILWVFLNSGIQVLDGANPIVTGIRLPFGFSESM